MGTCRVKMKQLTIKKDLQEDLKIKKNVLLQKYEREIERISKLRKRKDKIVKWTLKKLNKESITNKDARRLIKEKYKKSHKLENYLLKIKKLEETVKEIRKLEDQNEDKAIEIGDINCHLGNDYEDLYEEEINENDEMIIMISSEDEKINSDSSDDDSSNDSKIDN